VRRLVAAAVLAAWAPAAACSGGGGDKAPPGKVAPPGFGLTLGGADVQAVNTPPPPFPKDVEAAVLATLDTWLTTALVDPLRTGRPPLGVGPLFTAAAAARLAGPDQPALVESGAPVSGQVHQDRANVRLTAFTGPAGEAALVAAQLDVGLRVSSPGTRLAVGRTGEVVLVPEAGSWRIDSYDVRSQRDSPPPAGGPG
jgi:hypothetical protein